MSADELPSDDALAEVDDEESFRTQVLNQWVKVGEVDVRQIRTTDSMFVEPDED